jgi:kynurenine formamidase
MARILFDLSDCLSNETSDFEFNKHEITYLTPELTAVQSAEWGLGPDYWPDGVALSAEIVTLSTHSGTHVDAPLHYGPAVSGHTRTIDEVPLEWCYAPGVRLDLRHVEGRAGITRGDIEAALDAAAHELAPLDIVLLWTGTDLKQPGYESRHPGLRREATEYLVDRGIKLIGVDAWGIDRPFDVMIEDAVAGRAQFWESHLLGREKEYCQIERLANLETLPRSTGFTVSAFPFKLEGASAAWSRVVAIFEA